MTFALLLKRNYLINQRTDRHTERPSRPVEQAARACRNWQRISEAATASAACSLLYSSHVAFVVGATTGFVQHFFVAEIFARFFVIFFAHYILPQHEKASKKKTTTKIGSNLQLFIETYAGIRQKTLWVLTHTHSLKHSRVHFTFIVAAAAAVVAADRAKYLPLCRLFICLPLQCRLLFHCWLKFCYGFAVVV